MLNFWQGYKTYILAGVAIVYAVIGFFSGYMDIKQASDIILAALGFAGLRSGVDSALVLILQALGINVPLGSRVPAIRKAVMLHAIKLGVPVAKPTPKGKTP